MGNKEESLGKYELEDGKEKEDISPELTFDIYCFTWIFSRFLHRLDLIKLQYFVKYVKK